MYIRWIIYLCISLIVCSSCSDDDEVPADRVANRTVLFYMAADNNLSSYGVDNLQEILKGAQSHGLKQENLLVYMDPYRDVPMLLQIHENKTGEMAIDTLQRYPEHSSVSSDVMKGVIDEVLAAFPAQSYGLVLWSHGTSWLPQDFSSKLRSFGMDNQEEMEIETLADALPDKTFDYILFDACYMASIEVAYELRNKCNFIIGSPAEVLASGFPYRQIVPYLFGNEAQLQQICQAFYDFYNQKSGLYRSGAVTLTATAELEQLASMVQEILKDKEMEMAQLPLQDIQPLDLLSYRYHLLYDLDDFIRHLTTDEQYEDFQGCLDKVVRYAQTTPKITYGLSSNAQLAMEHYSGLSVYIPQSAYPQLNQWYQTHTAWGKAMRVNP